MEALQINVLNPEARKVLDSLAALKLIEIKKETNEEMARLLDHFSRFEDQAPSLEEITAEVEEVREELYQKRKHK